MFINTVSVFSSMEEETPDKHKKHHKEVQDLWEEIENREKEAHQEAHDEGHKDSEEEVMKEEE